MAFPLYWPSLSPPARPVLTPLLTCLLVLLALGAAERIARDRAWRAVPIRIHVNGTRAKSTVTRLVWSALVEAGIPAVARTTGTAPRLLMPDGAERPFPRRGPPNIRELLALLRLARRAGARAVVVECMALDPALQYAAERHIVHATVGVITNVRLDHTDVMGRDLDTIASTLSNTVPAGGALVAGEPAFAGLFRARAAALGTSVTVVRSSVDEGLPLPRRGWIDDDRAIALAVTRHLGIDDAVAARGFARAPLDPGAARAGVLTLGAGVAAWLDATAANDPESLAALTTEFLPGWTTTEAGAPGTRILVYNHRPDRPERIACFVEHSALVRQADRLVVTGARPPLSVWRRLRRVRPGRPFAFVPTRALGPLLGSATPGSVVVFCGNTRGLDVARALEEAVPRG
jgi:gamma-polyglutamate synthase